MSKRTSLASGAALGVLATMVAAGGAPAQTVHKHHAAKSSAAPSSNAVVQNELSELRAQVEALKAWKDAQVSNQAQSQAQLDAVKAQLAEAEAKANAAQQKVDAQIETIPGAVSTAVAAAAPKSDALYIKGVKLQFGGFVAAETAYRSKNELADMASTFSGIPLPNVVSGHTAQNVFSARQSRVSALAQGDFSPTVHLSGYGEFDFLGATPTANSVETDSYTPRIRVLYSTVDWDQDSGAFHLLAGQSWSLATMNQTGITPRTEWPPLSIDAQYVPGFVFARQPQVRFTVNNKDGLWFALSLENPQTTFYSSGHFLPGVSIATGAPGGSGYYSGNTYSFNYVPDIIGKFALDQAVDGHKVHAEVFGIYRDFYARLNDNGVSNNETVSGGGVGGAVNFQVVPKVLDAQFSGIWGNGVGRYGASQLPDVTLGVDGSIHPIEEWAMLAGLTFHVGTALDIYSYAGEERESQTAFSAGSIYNGLGNFNYDNSGCQIEGSSACVGNNQWVGQVAVGFWDRPYVGRFGRLQWGIQYSYTERQTFSGLGYAPNANENMIFTSIRYYPF